MGKETAISWTHHTFNPWWGCVKVSPGCAHCYAESFAKRVGEKVWGENSERRFFGDKHWNEPLKWNADAKKAGERRRVFCASMADWLEDREDLIESRYRLIDTIRKTQNLNWLLLSKRPENFRPLLKHLYDLMGNHLTLDESLTKTFISLMLDGWQRTTYIASEIGRENYWIGTTVENQEMVDKRIPELLDIPAKVRFLSCEPLLESVDISDFLWKSGCDPHCGERCSLDADCPLEPREGHWVIAGGESGPGFRPFNPDWARSLRDQCKAAGVAFHMKQMGGLKPSMMPPIPDDLIIREWPTTP